MSIDIAELRRLAEAATGSEWKFHEHGVGEFVVYTEKLDGDEAAICFVDDDPRYLTFGMEQQHCDMRFIAAANPAALLSLLDELEGLRKDAERYRWLRDQIKYGGLVIAKSTGRDLESWSGDDPDAAIDAALSGAEGKE